MKKPKVRKYYWDVEYFDKSKNEWFSDLYYGPEPSRRDALWVLNQRKRDVIAGTKLRIAKFVRAK